MSADGFDRITAFPGVETFSRRSKFQLEDFDTLEPGSLRWRVKGLWPSVGVCFVGGPSMSGKSFWVLDAMARVCRGEEILGRKSIPSGVVYIAAEGAHGVRNRIAGLRAKIGPLGAAFKFIGQAPNLTDPEDVDDLRGVLLEARAELAADGHELGIVAVDTLSASIPGADENSAADMSPVLHALQTMATELGVVVIVVAHTGKDEGRGLRGWSGLLANADGLIMLESPDNDLRAGTVVKVKDGKSGDRFGFSLEVVELDPDDDGDPVTTCVIQPENAPALGSKAGRKPTKAAATGDLILTAYGRVYDTRRVLVDALGADGAKGVEVSDLRAEAYKIGVGPSEPDFSECETDDDRSKAKRKWQDQRKADFDRGLEYLTGSRRLRTEDVKGVRLAWEPNKRSPA